MRGSKFALVVAAGTLLACSSLTVAQDSPTAIVYSGQISFENRPLTGAVDVEFAIFDAASGGTQVGQAIPMSGVAVQDGWFETPLDFGVVPAPGRPLWIEIRVRGAGTGPFTTLSPRQRMPDEGITRSDHGAPAGDRPPNGAGGSGGDGGNGVGGGGGGALIPGGLSAVQPIAPDDEQSVFDPDADGDGGGGRACDWTVSGSAIFYSCGNVGVGLANPLYPLHVEGFSHDRMIYGRNINPSGTPAGVYGEATAPNGRGVMGIAPTPGSGFSYGVYGRAKSQRGVGVFGEANSLAGYNTALWGQTYSPQGRGFVGVNASPTGTEAVGGHVQSNSNEGTALFALAYANSATNYAVRAVTNSSSGFAGHFTGKVQVANGPIIPAPGSTLGIMFPNDYFGGSGDSARIVYDSQGGEDTTLMIVNDNDGDDDISFQQFGLVRLKIENGQVQIPNGDLAFDLVNPHNQRQILNNYGFNIHQDVDNNSSGANISFFTNGGSIQQFRIEDGDEAPIYGDGTFFSNGIDFAEAFKSADADLKPGEVVSLSVGNWENCGRTQRAYDHHLLGVVSTKPGFCTGMSFEAEDAADPEIRRRRDEARARAMAATKRGDTAAADAASVEAEELTRQLREIVDRTHHPIALIGRVPCKVDGPVKAGDRLTSSEVPGHAMKQVHAGPSIGVALEDWNGAGPGKVMILVQPGWYGPANQESDALKKRVEALEAALASLAESR